MPRVALAGNPNTGKTTLFNQLCGLRAKTANFPGTTTGSRIGRCDLDGGGSQTAEIVDLPGTYRVHLDLPEARINRDVLGGEGLYRQPDAVVIVVDAANLSRNLCLVGEILGSGLPTVVALNMVDIARRRGLSLDAGRLAERLGCSVVPIVARRGRGLTDLRAAISTALTGGPRFAAEAAQRLALPDGADSSALITWADRVVEESVGGEAAIGSAADTLTERIDLAFTHPVLGVVVFALVMGGLFWTVFELATVPMDLIDLIFGVLGTWVTAAIPAGPVRDLLADGVISGIAGTVVFLPQICLLFFLISLLEDTGYLARAAFVMDRLLCRFGLPGHAFVPLLSSHACAIPGILSTRLIPDRRDRLATILVAPFMSCSARLPVYVLLTSLLFRDRPLLAGLAFIGCYLLGAAVAFASAFLARRTVLEGRSRPMVLELPSYKLPSLRTAVYEAAHQGRTFLEKAGTVIVGICIVMWWLSAYPRAEPPAEALELRRQAAEMVALSPRLAAERESEAASLEARHAQANSFAGRLGRTVQPIFEPLGYDWQLTVGVLTSFLAREVFVSTMAVLLTGEQEPDLEDDARAAGVIARIRSAVRDDGTPVFTSATAASLLVFFVLAMQCLPTLVVTRRETGSWYWAGLQLVYMTGVAWLLAFFTYHGLRLAGLS
ncbi:MAG: ferrous iron transporter B [bacterium]|nr:ferrous iron transporter B [bacterium]